MVDKTSDKPKRHRWRRRLAVTAAVLAVGGTVLAVVVHRMFRAQPDWYRPRAMSAVDRDAAAGRAEGKFRAIQNQAARSQAARTSRASGNRSSASRAAAGSSASASNESSSGATRTGTTRPGSAHAGDEADDKAMTVTFSDAELNAFFDKWAVLNGWKSSYGSYIDNPAIALRGGRLILAARLKELDTVASLHFEPRLDETGRLDMGLTRVLGGSLPLPHATLAGPTNKLIDKIHEHLPSWQTRSRIDPNGSANTGAIYATLGLLLIDTLAHQPGEPVLFLPVLGNGSMAVKVTRVAIADDTLTLTVEPLELAERDALLARIKGRTPQTADARPK